MTAARLALLVARDVRLIGAAGAATGAGVGGIPTEPPRTPEKLGLFFAASVVRMAWAYYGRPRNLSAAPVRVIAGTATVTD